MKVIECSADLIEEKDPFRKIERVGRTCYKSSSEMTDETAKKFFKGLTQRKHTAMVEHAVFVFQVSERVYHILSGHKFFNYSIEELEDGTERYLISANLRAINESKEGILLSTIYAKDADLVYGDAEFQTELISDDMCKIVDIDSIPDIQEHAYKTHKYLTFHFICDRGVSHEIVRHRPASYAQESTRYCNYSKDKFGSEITCIIPAQFIGNTLNNIAYQAWVKMLTTVEGYYMNLIDLGWTPQEARSVLPNALKTEVIMTANCREFDHFFDLRSRGVTGAPHPDMKVLADKALALYNKNCKF